MDRAWKCFRKTFYTEAAAHAALARWKAEDLCPGCERPEILTCAQCNHRFGEAPVQAQPEPQAQPVQPIHGITIRPVQGAQLILCINGVDTIITAPFIIP